LAFSVASWQILGSSPTLTSAVNEEGEWTAIGCCVGEENGASRWSAEGAGSKLCTDGSKAWDDSEALQGTNKGPPLWFRAADQANVDTDEPRSVTGGSLIL
jgi:hypothetical protein